MLRRILRMMEVYKVLMDLWVAVSDDGVPETEVVSSYPEPKVECYSIHLQCVQTKYKPRYQVKTICR